MTTYQNGALRGRLVAAVFSVTAFCVTATVFASAALLLRDGFDTETRAPEWAKELYFPYSGKIVTSPTRAGDGAMRFEWQKADHDGSNKTKHAELRAKPIPADVPKERWYGFSIYLPKDGMATDTSDEMIGQWHASPDKSLNEPHVQPPLAIVHQKDRLSLHWRYDTRRVSTTDQKTLNFSAADLGPVALDTWQDYVVHVKWDPFGKGVIRVWQDGKLVVDRKEVAIGYNDRVGTYWKVGIYKYPGKSDFASRFLYYDEAREAGPDASCTDVAPSADACGPARVTRTGNAR